MAYNYNYNGDPVNYLSLYEAARHGNLEKLKLLLDGQEDEISLYDNSHHWKVSDSILCYAANNGHTNIVKYMADTGVDLTVRDNHALCYAALNNHIDVVKFIMSTTEIDDYSDVHTAVCYSARNGHTDMIKTLNAVADSSRYLETLGENIYTTAIYWASHTDKRETIKYLVSAGAPTTFLTNTQKQYIDFCQKMQEKKRIRAQKKIYFWWIQICYDLEHHTGCGQRMARRNLEMFESMMKA